MEKDDIVLLLADKALIWDDFLHFMSGKQMELTLDYGIRFPKKEVYNFIDLNTYNKENNYD